MQRLTFDNELTTIYEHPLEQDDKSSVDIDTGL